MVTSTQPTAAPTKQKGAKKGAAKIATPAVTDSASPVNDRLRATPGTIERIMRAVDDHFGDDADYQQHRDTYVYRLQRLANETKQDGTPYTTGEAIGLVGEDLANKKANAAEIARQKQGKSPSATPRRHAPLPTFRQAHAGELSADELKASSSGTLTDAYNITRAEGQDGIKRGEQGASAADQAGISQALRSIVGELTDYSRVVQQQGEKAFPKIEKGQVTEPVRRLYQLGRCALTGVTGGLASADDLYNFLGDYVNAPPKEQEAMRGKITDGDPLGFVLEQLGGLGLGVAMGHVVPSLPEKVRGFRRVGGPAVDVPPVGEAGAVANATDAAHPSTGAVETPAPKVANDLAPDGTPILVEKRPRPGVKPEPVRPKPKAEAAAPAVETVPQKTVVDPEPAKAAPEGTAAPAHGTEDPLTVLGPERHKTYQQFEAGHLSPEQERAFVDSLNADEKRRLFGIGETHPATAAEPSPVTETKSPEAAPHSTPESQPIAEPHAPTSSDAGQPTTAPRTAIVEAERAAHGHDPVELQHYTTPTEAMESGRAAVQSGAADHEALAREVSATPRPISAHEHGVLLETGAPP